MRADTGWGEEGWMEILGRGKSQCEGRMARTQDDDHDAFLEVHLRHINSKHMTQQRLTDMQTQTTQKYSHERDPAAVLQQSAQQAFFAETPAHDGEGDVAKAGEDGEETEVGGEAGAVVGVEPAAVPSCGEGEVSCVHDKR